jgi:hypothetical protein
VIYLHEVVDVWFEREVKPRLFGRCRLIRYADDLVMVFEQERDARRVMDVFQRPFVSVNAPGALSVSLFYALCHRPLFRSTGRRDPRR